MAEKLDRTAWASYSFGMAREILIVDDSLVARMAIKNFLSTADASFREASSSEEALSLLDGGYRPALVYLDLTMPGMGGAKTLKEIRARHPTMLVVVITADVQASTLEELGALGVSGVIRKPADKVSVLTWFGKAGG